MLPPSLPAAAFRTLSESPTNLIESRFLTTVEGFRDFLNALAPLSLLQAVRRKGRSAAFSRSARPESQHWWISHEGGRNEAQWNFGMFPCHLRFGIGFNRTRGRWGDPGLVDSAFTKFLEALREREISDPGFSNRLRLEVEEYDSIQQLRCYATSDLLRPGLVWSNSGEWLFVGRLLRIGDSAIADPHKGCEQHHDADLLCDSRQLAAELRLVAEALWPLWLKTR